jgi:hypothetical protein
MQLDGGEGLLGFATFPPRTPKDEDDLKKVLRSTLSGLVNDAPKLTEFLHNLDMHGTSWFENMREKQSKWDKLQDDMVDACGADTPFIVDKIIAVQVQIPSDDLAALNALPNSIRSGNRDTYGWAGLSAVRVLCRNYTYGTTAERPMSDTECFKARHRILLASSLILLVIR